MEKGSLYLVATPIGNMDDMTFRAVRVLQNVDLIACEDTRHSRYLLEHYQIGTRTTSCFEGNEEKKVPEIISYLLEGKDVAVISDAGMPGISDPGYRLVKSAIDTDIQVVPVPGPSAPIAALVASGLATHRFVFEGFLPSKQISRRKKMITLLNEERTLIFFESPQRLLSVLEDFYEIFGDRSLCIARELSKVHEEILRGNISTLIERVKKDTIKGEIVLIMEGRLIQENWEGLSLQEHIQQIEKKMGLTKKEAIRLVADLRGLSKRDVYQSTF